MARPSRPIRIDRELYESAKLVAESQSRTTEQQLEHWVRIGLELEASRSLSPDVIPMLLERAKARAARELDDET